MKISLDTNQGYVIESYDQQGIVIHQQNYNHSLILTANQLQTWEIKCFQQLTETLMQPLFALQPDIIILGTGQQQYFLSPSQMAWFISPPIGIEVMPTLAACRTYNILLSEGRNIVAGLIL